MLSWFKRAKAPETEPMEFGIGSMSFGGATVNLTAKCMRCGHAETLKTAETGVGSCPGCGGNDLTITLGAV